jgi:dihydroneopterin aldolase
MTTMRILVSGIRALGRHGANPGERLEVQEFVVDLDVVVDVDGDALEDTADYRALAAAARTTVESGSFVLLETLARQVARAVFQLEGVERASAVVHKPGAARSMGVDDVAVEATSG